MDKVLSLLITGEPQGPHRYLEYGWCLNEETRAVNNGYISMLTTKFEEGVFSAKQKSMKQTRPPVFSKSPVIHGPPGIRFDDIRIKRKWKGGSPTRVDSIQVNVICCSPSLFKSVALHRLVKKTFGPLTIGSGALKRRNTWDKGPRMLRHLLPFSVL
ncbi:hypothetical protein MG293_020204 [Ovis ammon polii]|uniref:Uncharacterized protein n=1 Tax=Ovis ammon polii TaxID=230172 RepID=A0AAD4Y0V8_OVIAM|nr:hypothetical protein MG293_020204 [Ovis ammon polii]